MGGNQDLVDALTKFDNGRGLSSFIQKNQFPLCEHTISPNLILAFFKAHESISADTQAPNSLFDKNTKLYHHIQKVGNPRNYVDALEQTGNEGMLKKIREILKLSQQNSGAGGEASQISREPGNEPRGSSSGIRNEPPVHKNKHESQPLPSSSSGFPNGDGPFSKLSPEKAESYKGKNVRVLFINQKFDSVGKSNKKEYTENKRSGADADGLNVAHLFGKSLGMKLDVEENVDSDEIHGILKRFKRKCLDDKNDGSIVIVSTHGSDPHSLLMDDLEWIDLEQDVVQQFGREKFPGFIGKPKIFILNACRTEVTQEDSSRASLEYEDILIVHSTVPYYASFRSEKSGSCFIKILHDVYMENKNDKLEIRKLLHMVGRKVGEDLDCENRVQISEIRDRLFDKNFYLPCVKSNQSLLTKFRNCSVILLAAILVVLLAIWYSSYNMKWYDYNWKDNFLL